MDVPFQSVHEHGKVNSVIDEENRTIIAHQVPNPILGIKLNGKPS